MKHTSKLLILILPFLLAACAQEKMTNIAPDFRTFALRFQEEAAKQGVHVEINNVKIAFDDEYELQRDVIGVCRYGGPLIVPEIYIKRSFFESNSRSSREELLFHEMGHCILNRRHRSDPRSIMFFQHSGHNRDHYEKNYNAIMVELFTGVIENFYSYYNGDNQFNVAVQTSGVGYNSSQSSTQNLASTSKITSDNVVEYKTSSVSDENGNPVFGCGSDEEHEHSH